MLEEITFPAQAPLCQFSNNKMTYGVAQGASTVELRPRNRSTIVEKQRGVAVASGILTSRSTNIP